MKQSRKQRVLQLMKEEQLDQLIVSDPYSIFYLTGKWIFPGERLLALYLNLDGDVKLIVNELFPQEPDPDLEYVWVNDIDNGVEILVDHMTDGEKVGVDKEWPAKFLLEMQRLLPDKIYSNGSLIIDQVRLIKDEEEQQAMIESSKLNDQVMEELITYVGKGMSELELTEQLKEIYRSHGITEYSFEPIIAFGANGADPHHETDDSRGVTGDSVVLDIGGFYNNYASDMTRTVFLGEVSDKQREVYEIVKEATARGIAAAKPGNKMSDVDKACRDYIESHGYGEYFTHRTGHSIGLEDHEYGDVSSANDAIIQVGQCFSVEPGIYLPGEFGVRIEDLVLITEDGCQVLNHYPKELEVIEED